MLSYHTTIFRRNKNPGASAQLRPLNSKVQRLALDTTKTEMSVDF